MLWYKAWLETRMRFTLALAGTMMLCAYRIYEPNQSAPTWASEAYYYFVLRSGHQLLAVMWMVAMMLLTMGGLLQEKANGSISFTLGLPVSRKQLMAIRIGMALLQAASLVIVPWAVMYTTAYLMGPARSASQALFYCVVLAGGGAVFAAVGLFVSSIVEGTYTAPLISAGVALLCGNAPRSLDSLNPIAFMTGKAYLSASNQVVGPWPWGHLAAYVGIAAVLIWASVKALERRDL